MADPKSFFVNPRRPTIVRFYSHDHDWYEMGADRQPNGVWLSLWGCRKCPDVGYGGAVGPIPAGYCGWCGWVQKGEITKRCEECHYLLDDLDPDDEELSLTAP